MNIHNSKVPQLIYGMLSVYLLVMMYYHSTKFHKPFLSTKMSVILTGYVVSMYTVLNIVRIGHGT